MREDWFQDIRYFYKQGLWTEQMVYDAVGKEYISVFQYQLITGKNYSDREVRLIEDDKR